MKHDQNALSETRKEQIRQEILRKTQEYLNRGGTIQHAAETEPVKPRRLAVRVNQDYV